MSRRKPLGEFLGKALDGRSQAQLARELGVSRSTVHGWAAGKREIPERYRDSLKAAARPGRSVPAPPLRITRSGRPTRTAGSATITKLPGGNENVYTHARSAFARELKRLSAAGKAPTSFSVALHAFRGADSPLTAPTRTRIVEVKNLTPDEIRALASGNKDALESAITRAIQARNYTGGFTFRRATKFSFDSTP
jgi:hypothetical protein